MYLATNGKLAACMYSLLSSMASSLSDSPTGLCEVNGGTVPGGGWWGLESAFLTQVDRCQTEDLPAGLHWIYYRHPKDEARPDNVTIVRSTNVKWKEKTSSEKVPYFLHFSVAKIRISVCVLLSLVDGAAAPDGRMTYVTTNFPYPISPRGF